MITQRCPKCNSSRIRRGYRPTSLLSKLIFRYNLLCDNCNWEFAGFALPLGSDSSVDRKKPAVPAGSAEFPGFPRKMPSAEFDVSTSELFDIDEPASSTEAVESQEPPPDETAGVNSVLVRRNRQSGKKAKKPGKQSPHQMTARHSGVDDARINLTARGTGVETVGPPAKAESVDAAATGSNSKTPRRGNSRKPTGGGGLKADAPETNEGLIIDGVRITLPPPEEVESAAVVSKPAAASRRPAKKKGAAGKSQRKKQPRKR